MNWALVIYSYKSPGNAALADLHPEHCAKLTANTVDQSAFREGDEKLAQKRLNAGVLQLARLLAPVNRDTILSYRGLTVAYDAQKIRLSDGENLAIMCAR